MRKWTWTLTGLLLAGTLHAQQQQPPAAPPAVNPSGEVLDRHLNNWEMSMKDVTSLVGPCTRIEINKTFNTTKTYEGIAKFLKPNMAYLELRNKDKPELFEKYICSGQNLYEYAPANKVIRVHDIPDSGKDGSFLSFLFGMKAEDAKKRYDLKLTKEDQYYVYVEVKPKMPGDKADFTRAQLVLIKGTFLPRRLWFEQPNGDEVTWELPKTEKNVPVNRGDFNQPLVPQGWQFQRMPKATEVQPNPRVIRGENR